VVEDRIALSFFGEMEVFVTGDHVSRTSPRSKMRTRQRGRENMDEERYDSEGEWEVLVRHFKSECCLIDQMTKKEIGEKRLAG